MKSKLVPALRFPEFKDCGEWEEKRLGEVASILQGCGFPIYLQGNQTGKYPFYKVSDISTSFCLGSLYISKANHYIDESILNILKVTPIPIGSIIFAKIGEALRLNRRVITSALCLIDNNVVAIKSLHEEITDYFLFLILTKIDLNEFCGGAIPSVNKSTLANIQIHVPSLPEQQKIADCLTSLDELINAQSEKIAELKSHKQGLMQKLFPSKGAKLPELRFPEFKDCGEWEERKLGDVSIHIINKVGDQQLEPLSISAGIGFIEQSKKFGKNISGNQYKNYIISKKGYFSYNKGNSKKFPEGCIYYLKNFEMAAIPNAFITFALKSGEALEFYQKMFEFNFHGKELKKYITSGARSDGLLNVNKKDFFSIKLPHAKPREQQKIADCLTSLDELIEKHENKLELLKEHKKGLMQGLFPNVDRQKEHI